MTYGTIVRILDRLPGYCPATPKRAMRKIRELLTELEYDEDFINGINDEFCQGFGTAKEIFTRLFHDRYWEEDPRTRERQTPKPPERYLSPGVCICPGCHRTLEAHASKIFCCYCGQMLTYENEREPLLADREVKGVGVWGEVGEILEAIQVEIDAGFECRIGIPLFAARRAEQLKTSAVADEDMYRYGYGKSLDAYLDGKRLVDEIIRRYRNQQDHKEREGKTDSQPTHNRGGQ